MALEDDPDMGKRLKAVESAVVAFSASQRGKVLAAQDEVCRLFNQKRCHFLDCKFRHACKRCGGTHPVLDCQASTKPFEQAGRLAPGPAGHAASGPCSIRASMARFQGSQLWPKPVLGIEELGTAGTE